MKKGILVATAAIAAILLGAGVYYFDLLPAAHTAKETLPEATAKQVADIGSLTTPLKEKPAVQPDDIAIGDAMAPVTIIEYSSLSCPHCAHFNNDILPELKAEYIDTGKVRLIQRDFPLNKQALQAAMLVHCVSPVSASGMMDILFRAQDRWLQEDALTPLNEIALSAGVTHETYDKCLRDRALLDKIVATRKEGEERYEIRSTPTFLIEDRKMEGVLPYEEMKQVIEDLLQKKS